MSKKQTIFMVTNNYTPYSGGVVSSLQSLTTQLRALGHRVIIVTLDFCGKHEPELDIVRLPCFFRFNYRQNPIAVPFRPYKQIADLINQLQPDIVHVHHPFGLGTIATQIAKKENIPVVFTHHTLYEHYAHYVPLPTCFTKPIVRYVVSRFCNHVDYIIAPSQSVKDYLKTFDITTPVQVIPSGLMPLFFKEYSAKQTMGSRQIHLLTVSRFTTEKNIFFLLDVFALLHKQYPLKYHLTLAGYGPLLPQLKKYAACMKIPASIITFAVKPEKTELVHLYRAADIFLFASQSETQGLVLAEAMSQGTPVIALNGPGSNDIIVNGYNGFIVKTKEEMAEKIERITSDQKMCAQLQTNAYKTACNYKPDVLVKHIISVYEKVNNYPAN